MGCPKNLKMELNETKWNFEANDGVGDTAGNDVQLDRNLEEAARYMKQSAIAKV